MSQPSYRYYHWGPFLLHTQITPDECRMLLEEGKKYRKKYKADRANLPDYLSEEYNLTDARRIHSLLKKYLKIYAEGYAKWRGGNHKLPNFNTSVFEAIWINYMKSNDFQPPHHHQADLAFIMYPDMPQVIIEENKNYKGTLAAPGGIAWFYGDGNQQYIDNVKTMPQTGDLFIFPGSLKHWVFPFRSKVERISVAGNILLGKSNV